MHKIADFLFLFSRRFISTSDAFLLRALPPGKAVVFLDRDEFKSTWLGNKSIYRTRMAMADGGELIVMAPGVAKFGEDPDIDALIRRVRWLACSRLISVLNAPCGAATSAMVVAVSLGSLVW